MAQVDRGMPAPDGLPGSGDLLSAACAVALLGSLFGLQWFGVAGVPDPSYARPAVSGTVDGFNGLPIVRWILLVTIVAAVGSLLLHLSQRAHGVSTDTGAAVAALGGCSSALLIWRVLIALPGGGRVIDQKLGALVGLACALGIVLGGLQTVAGQRLTRAAGARPRRRLVRRRTSAGPSPSHRG